MNGINPGQNKDLQKHVLADFMQKKLSTIVCWIIILVVVISNLHYKFWQEKDRVIAHDVIAYYQYLPATFIYHDLTMEFLDGVPEEVKSHFSATRTEKGWKIGKMTMGMAFIYFPFFITAHLAAPVLGYPADGFSVPYMVALILASIVFLGLGLFFLRAFLRRYFNEIVTAVTLLLIGLATNLYFYSVIQPAMSHVFSFALFALFLLLLDKWLENPGWKNTILMGLTAGLIILIRPSNGIIVILIPLWGVVGIPAIKQRWSFIIKQWPKVLLIAGLAFLVILPQMIYWKYASGHWLTYTYDQERFFFSNPQVLRGMLSYRKGWLVYTPVMFFALAGMIPLYRQYRKLFWPLLWFFMLNTYIVFSWWNWWYGGGFSQRALIESYTVLSMPLAALINWVFTKQRMVIGIFILLSVWFIFLNIFQSRQYYFGSIHWEAMTKKAYWDSFLRYQPSERFQELLQYPDTEKAMQGEN